MSKHADVPLCPDRACSEDRYDMIEVVPHKRYIEYCCKSCGRHWKVPKPSEE